MCSKVPFCLYLLYVTKCKRIVQHASQATGQLSRAIVPSSPIQSQRIPGTMATISHVLAGNASKNQVVLSTHSFVNDIDWAKDIDCGARLSNDIEKETPLAKENEVSMSMMGGGGGWTLPPPPRWRRCRPCFTSAFLISVSRGETAWTEEHTSKLAINNVLFASLQIVVNVMTRKTLTQIAVRKTKK